MPSKHRLTRVTILTMVLILAVLNGAALAREKGKNVKFDYARTASFMREMEARPDFPVSVVLANDYVCSLQRLGETIAPAKRAAIVNYLKNAQQKDGGFISDKANRNSSLLFTDLALETLGCLKALDAMDTGKVKAFVLSLKNSDGGYGFSAQARESSLATTFYAIRILKAVNSLDLVDREKTAQYVKGFERSTGGFGYVKGNGAANARNSYMAGYVLNSIGKLDQATRNRALRFMATTPYLDRKSKEKPALDEQLYALMALKELRAERKIDRKLAVSFLKKLYIPVNGGFGPMEGYGSTPDSTTTAVRVLEQLGELKKAPPQVAKK